MCIRDRTYARYDFIAERAEGMYLYDEKGVAYLDFYGGVAAVSYTHLDVYKRQSGILFLTG